MIFARKVSRRQFIQLSSMATASIVVTACSDGTSVSDGASDVSPAADTPSQASDATPPSQYGEAPQLAELVANGDLPSVDERLPQNPTVVAVIDSIGNYGGTIRRGFKGVSDRWGPTKLQDNSLILYDLDMIKHPNMIESWEQNDDATAVTLHLREGLK